MTAIDPNHIFQQFEAAAQRRGLILPKAIIADGKIHRCDVQGKRRKRGKGDGSYLLHLDGAVPAGGLNNWTDGTGWQDWAFDTGRELTEFERAELRRKHEAARKARNEDRARTLVKAQAKARRLWSGAIACANHPYLSKKKIAANGARLLYNGSLLAVPLLDANGTVQNLQFITHAGDKRFLKGSTVTGLLYEIPGEPGRICISEGFATAASIHAATGRTAIVAFDAGNLRPVAEVIRRKHPDAEIVVCADDDKNHVGVDKAIAAAQAIGGLVAVPDFGRNRRERDTDFNDLAGWIGDDAVRRCIEAATTPPPVAVDANVKISELSKLKVIDFERQRKAAAKELGITTAALDKVVKAARQSSKQGTAVAIEDIDPWPSSVDGASLLDEMAAALTAHISMHPVEADTVALWSVYSHAYHLFPVSPRLGIRAATAECGKTELLRRIKRFVNRPFESDGMKAAPFFRLIDESRPTLLLDELDNCLPEDKSEMLGAMNGGYSRKGQVLRCVGDNNEVRAFKTFAPFVYAMIGKPTNSFDSRTIVIELRRASPEKARSLRSLEDDSPEDTRLSDMGRKAARWIKDNLGNLAAARPDMGGLVNRPAMNWRPLFAVADLAGGAWPGRAREAAASAAAIRADLDIKAELIIDIKAILDAAPTVDEWPSELLVNRLVAMEGRPWAEFGKDERPITKTKLSRWLSKFQISSMDVGPGDRRKKGYHRWQFDEVFASYASPPDSNRASAQNAMNAEEVSTFKTRSQNPPARFENAKKSNNDRVLRGCAVSEGGCDQEEAQERPELAAEAPPTVSEAPEPLPPAPRTEPVPPRAPVVSPKIAADDPDLPGWMNRSLPAAQREAAWRLVRPRERLGAPAISAGPDDDLGDIIQ